MFNRHNSDVNCDSCLTIFSQNIRYLKSKLRIEDLESFLNEYKPSLVCLSELAIVAEDVTNVKVTNYNLATFFSRAKFKNKQAGGVGIFVNEHHNFITKTIDISKYCKDYILEAVAVKLVFDGQEISLLNIYRSPIFSLVDDFIQQLDNLLQFLLKNTSQVILCGDLNIDLLEDTSSSRKLNSLLQSYNLTCFVNIPTRISSSSATCIDHVFSDINPNNIEVEVMNTALSDHFGIFMSLPKIKINRTIKDKTKFRIFNEKNYDQFERFMLTTDWEKVYNYTMSADEASTNFFNKTAEIFNIVFPKKHLNKNKKSTPPWSNEELRQDSENLRNMYLDSKALGSKHLKMNYKIAKKKYHKKYNMYRKNYNSSRINKAKNKAKASWEIVNEMRNNNNSSGNIKEICVDGNTYTDPEQISDIFNRFFIEVSEAKTDVSDKNLDQLFAKIPPVKDELNIEEFTEEEIYTALKNLKNKKASGDDEITVAFIIKFSRLFIPHLLHLFNRCLHEGVFPSVLKVSKVMPSFKNKGCPTCMDNYRPISLTSSFAKIFEKLMSSKIVCYLEQNKVLSDCQFGYRKSVSTSDAIIYTIKKILSVFEKEKTAIGIFLDLSKAFDRVQFPILLFICKKLGFSQGLIKLLESFLTNRKQYVFLKAQNKEFRSQYSTPLCSVPQGSILGPLLFLIYINFLPLLANNDNACMFVDDNTIIHRGMPDIENEIAVNISLNSYVQSLGDLYLLANLRKTNYITFKKTNTILDSDLSLCIGDNILEEVESIKFLGVHIDQNLSWDTHVEYVLSKLASSIFLLRRISPVTDLKTKLMVFHAIFQSRISYCLLVWGSTSIKNLDSILICQKRALRVIFNLRHRDSCKDLFKKNNILTVFALYVFQLLIYIKKNHDDLKTVGSNHEYNTRNGYLLLKEKNSFKSNTVENGIQYFNLLPTHITDLSMYSFKKTVKDKLIEIGPYNFEEIKKELKSFPVKQKSK